jgi:protein TonB
MSYLINNQQKMYEIIFARRNKAYGAYAIRSAYGNTVFKSLLFMAMGFVSIFSAALYMSQKPQMDPAQANIPPIDTVTVIPFDGTPPEPKKPEPPRANPPRSNPSGESGIGTQVDSTAAETQSTGLAVNTSTGTSTDPIPTGPETPTGSISGTTTTGTPSVNLPPVIDPDTPPEFEGGLKALYRFLSEHLQYPPSAMDVGKEGTAYVRFVVDENGKVGTLNLMNNLGYGLDEEALRVVGMIPKFKKPGTLHGNPVKVYYQLPIRFRLR